MVWQLQNLPKPNLEKVSSNIDEKILVQMFTKKRELENSKTITKLYI